MLVRSEGRSYERSCWSREFVGDSDRILTGSNDEPPNERPFPPGADLNIQLSHSAILERLDLTLDAAKIGRLPVLFTRPGSTAGNQDCFGTLTPTHVSIKDDRLVLIDQDSVLQVGAHRLSKNGLLHILALAD